MTGLAPRSSVVVELAGEQDLASAEDLRARVAEALGEGRDVTLDLRAVTFCDTSGLDAIVAAHRSGQELGATVTLRAVPAHVRRTLEITGLDRVLHLV